MVVNFEFKNYYNRIIVVSSLMEYPICGLKFPH